jgi:uncharacterized membrane protein YfcA
MSELSSLLPPGVSAYALAALMAVALVASIARGFSGFGAALIFMPLASAVAAPRTAAALLLIIDLVAAAPFAPNAWKKADRKAVSLMVFGSLLTVPLGTYALTQFHPVTTRWIISAFVAALLALLVSGWRYHGKAHPSATIGVGGVAGFCSGLAQTGGPPVVAYWLGQPLVGAIARANIILYFAMSDVISFVTYTASGILTLDIVKLALFVGPVYGLGLYIGAQLFGVASETLFRRVCYSLIALAALVSLPALDPILGR